MSNLNLVNEILEQTLVCACEALDMGFCDEEGSQCGCPCRFFVSAGPPVADLEACCNGGQLTVHLDRIYQHENFPAQAGGPVLCQVPLAADIVVTLYRCFPTMNDDGSAPSGPELDLASKDIHRDLYLLTMSVICCLLGGGRRRKFTFNGSRIIPPQGGCIGAELRFSIELQEL